MFCIFKNIFIYPCLRLLVTEGFLSPEVRPKDVKRWCSKAWWPELGVAQELQLRSVETCLRTEIEIETGSVKMTGRRLMLLLVTVHRCQATSCNSASLILPGYELFHAPVWSSAFHVSCPLGR